MPCRLARRANCLFVVSSSGFWKSTEPRSSKLGNFALRGSVDFQNPEDETTNKQLARRARRHGTLALDYAVGPLTTGVETQFSGKRFEDAGDTTVLGGYALVNFYGNYALTREWSVFGRWNNVLNKDYELASTYATPKSNIFVGLQYGFR